MTGQLDGPFDVIVIGAGTAGLPTAISAAERGARTLLVDKSDDIGGTLHVTAGQMSAAGTELQRRKGIEDHPDSHFEDAIRIAKGTSDADLVRLAVDLAPGTLDWLTGEGFEFDPVCPKIFYGHEAYSVARTYWGVDGGRSHLKVLRRLLARARETGRLDLRLETKMTGLTGDGTGAITGIEVRGAGGGVERIEGKNVVLTTGGYGADPKLFARLTQGFPLFTCAMPTSTGEGILCGESAGGVIRNGEKFLPTFGGIEVAGEPGRIDFENMPNLIPQVRPPWEIYVNLKGRRFVAEDNPSVDAREHALMKQPEMTFWIVFDDHILRNAPPFLGNWLTNRNEWDAASIEAAFDSHPSFRRGATLAELAGLCGLDESALSATVADYNRAAKTGNDPLGRTNFPAPISQPPFYAVKAHGTLLKSPAGLTINTKLQVLDKDGRPIPNLHALGEAIGGATLSGQSFVGGMSVTPALGFGRLLGGKLLQW